MRFLVSEIRNAGPVQREETTDAAELLGKAPDMVSFRHPVKSRVKAMMTHEGEIIFSGRVETTFTFQCGRCLDTFERPVKMDFQQVVTPQGDDVDLSSEIRETVFLDLPVSAVCRDACKGICPNCGTNLNKSTCACASTRSDVRWEALKQLRFK